MGLWKTIFLDRCGTVEPMIKDHSFRTPSLKTFPSLSSADESLIKDHPLLCPLFWMECKAALNAQSAMTVILGWPLLKPFPPFIFQHKWTTEKLLITFNIALFSALNQIHCTLVTCNSKWVQIFKVHFEYPPVVYLHRCLVVKQNCCHIGTFCVHCTTMHHVTSLYATLHM